MEEQVHLYVNVDSAGNIKRIISGGKIHPVESFHYFFIREPEVVEDIHLYKVVVTDMVPDLVLK